MIAIVSADKVFLMVIVVIVILYMPLYSNRKDFIYARNASIDKENNIDKIEAYHWIVKNIPSDEVILCEHSDAIFPVMATGRKMVSINVTFSNPYVDFNKREKDHDNMLEFLSTGEPETAVKLFNDYNVRNVMLKNSTVANQKIISKFFGRIIFQNNEYTIFKKI